MPIFRSVSPISGNPNQYFAANFRFSSDVSKLTPMIVAFFFLYSSVRSRNPVPSAVHPGVSAFG